ncbi:hypothetical protein RJ639_004389 [Escallonia herrerae]|uniref:Nitroreductase n=1 Tax=Escallonia herrerae TaxID=1293975 RepID=A0AA88W4J1_9ASTE|nr:hypothetical protein RJ639_004389 [Escallonia herrerae]
MSLFRHHSLNRHRLLLPSTTTTTTTTVTKAGQGLTLAMSFSSSTRPPSVQEQQEEQTDEQKLAQPEAPTASTGPTSPTPSAVIPPPQSSLSSTPPHHTQPHPSLLLYIYLPAASQTCYERLHIPIPLRFFSSIGLENSRVLHLVAQGKPQQWQSTPYRSIPHLPINRISVKHPFCGALLAKRAFFGDQAEIPSGFLPKHFPDGSFLVGLSSIFRREAWKYGERAFRYCNHDVGHAIGAVSMAAAGLGWDVKVLDGLGCEDLEKLMGVGMLPKFEIPSRPVKGKLPEIEFEHPDCVLLVFPNGIGEFNVDYEDLSEDIAEFAKLEWNGKPNVLSKEHVCWDIIYRTAEVVKKPVKKPLNLHDNFVVDPFQSSGVFRESAYKGFSLREVVRNRRSAGDVLSDAIALYAHGFGERRQLALLYRAIPWDSEVHAVMFVHRVLGLPKGLYFLVRNEDHFDDLKKATRPEFKWEKPEGCPDELPLYELAKIDCQELAKHAFCAIRCNVGVLDLVDQNIQLTCNVCIGLRPGIGDVLDLASKDAVNAVGESEEGDDVVNAVHKADEDSAEHACSLAPLGRRWSLLR